MKKSILITTMVLISVSLVIGRDFAFPSPLPPNFSGQQQLDTIKQIVSIIWDDNAYSGMIGTNYEGPSTVAGQFTTINWIGGRRVEGDWSTTGPNELGIQAGDIGMSWATMTLSGHEAVQAMPWVAMADYRQGDQVTYEGYLWVARAWTGAGTVPVDDPNAEPWAPGWNRVRALGGGTPSRRNPDGSNVTMTFNVISGLFTPTAPFATYMSRESKFGWFRPNDEFFPVGTPSTNKHDRIAVAWGREHAIYMSAADYGNPRRRGVIGYIEEAFKDALTVGHEIGNHTIDHMETNSPLPFRRGSMLDAYPAFAQAPGNVGGAAFMDGSANWGGEGMVMAGEGGRLTGVTLPDGQKLESDQVIHFGQREGNAWQYMGWHANAGRALSVNAWEGLIRLGESELQAALGISVANGQVTAFRAPRLEVNSNLFHALKRAGYLYDTGNEEGYEYNTDGTNFLWPYTMDNGSPNVAWQRMVGSNRSNWDSLPSELWQYPVSVFIIPEQHREELWNNYVAITTGAADGTTPTAADREHFLKIGKITGFDFNLFVLNGATRQIASDAMKFSLDQRMRGGKAPFQVGAHTDYFTPIYDHATLLNDVNRTSYGLVVTRGWNTWRDRIAVFEEFVDYGLGRGAYFWDGRKAINYVKQLASQVTVGADKKVLDNWQFFSHGTKTQHVGGNLSSGADITTTQTPQDQNEEVTGFATFGNAGDFEFDHISLRYSTTAPITIRLITNNPLDQAYPYEVTLSNLNGFNNWDGSRPVNKSRFVDSREIPLSAFQRKQYVYQQHPNLVGLNAPDTEFTRTITGIEIAVQVPLVSSFSWRNDPALSQRVRTQANWLSVQDFTLHSGNQVPPATVGISNVNVANLPRTAIMGMTSGSMKLSIARAGTYNIDILSANGRVIKSLKNVDLGAGVNTLPLNNLAKGMYVIRIHNRNFNTSLKSLVL
jgi:peptidoglycan/xylan/chitin deacetylase (PgdA/CDA1 family)